MDSIFIATFPGTVNGWATSCTVASTGNPTDVLSPSGDDVSAWPVPSSNPSSSPLMIWQPTSMTLSGRLSVTLDPPNSNEMLAGVPENCGVNENGGKSAVKVASAFVVLMGARGPLVKLAKTPSE